MAKLYSEYLNKLTNEIVKDSFSDLPGNAEIGAKGIFAKNNGFGIAIKFEHFWQDDAGNKSYDPVNHTISAENCTVALTVGGQSVTSLKYADVATITATASEGYTMSTLTVNGESHTSGQAITVSGDVVIEAVATETPEDVEE